MATEPPELIPQDAAAELLSSEGGATILRLPLEGARAMIGRAPSNDIVFADSRISWHHALLWTEGGALWLRDLGSTNSTFLGSEAVKQPTMIHDRAHINFAKAADLWVRLSGGSPQQSPLVLEDLSSRLVYPLLTDRFVIGSGPEADLRLDSGPEVAATLMLYEEREIWLGVDAIATPVEVGVQFEAAGCPLRIREAADIHVVTEIASIFRYPYHLSIPFSSSVPRASLVDPQRGRRIEVTAENRVALMYVLAKRLIEDRAAGKTAAAEGWCTDQEVGVSVWGRSWHEQTSNNLHVILHRLRKQLKGSGFDPWCIEKKRGKLRLRIQGVTTS
ncbi:MAG: hypothetical protein ACI8S6_004932 [Myxococcota bacterium]|jgi:hypothetical protein